MPKPVEVTPETPVGKAKNNSLMHVEFELSLASLPNLPMSIVNLQRKLFVPGICNFGALFPNYYEL